MIISFRHHGLKKLFTTGRSRFVPAFLQGAALIRLQALHRAQSAADLNLPGYGLRRMCGGKATRFAIDLSQGYTLTFILESGQALAVDLENTCCDRKK